MPTEEKSTMDLLEETERAAYEELKKLNFDDPNRKNVLNEAKTCAELRMTYEQNENTRLNNNAKNDLDEQRLVIEAEKVKNDKNRVRVDFTKGMLYFVGGIFSGFSSYMMSDWFQDYKPLTRFSEKMHDLLVRK